MYLYTRNLRKTRIMRVRPIEEQISTSKFYGQPIYEAMSKRKAPYDAQGPIVQCKSYEENIEDIRETSFSDTSTKDTKIANLPAIINSN